jgi:transcriptional regulator with XRE-family HTH domain
LVSFGDPRYVFVMTQPTPTIGDLIREWRQRRRLSQFDLACDAGISPKHVSFLETGRAQPDREMLLHLAERMGIPLRDRNVMLSAAGFDPPYQERPLDDPAFRVTRHSIDLMLRMHEPNPAMAIDRHWNMAASNKALSGLVADVDPLLLSSPVNLVRLYLHPAGLAPRIINLAEWRQHLLARLRRQIDTTGDPELLTLVEEVSRYALVPDPVRRAKLRDFETLAVPLRLATVHGPLAFFSTTTVFGRPVDITLAELAIEAFFPADAATASAMRRMPAELMPVPVAAHLTPRDATRTPRLARRAATG